MMFFNRFVRIASRTTSKAACSYSSHQSSNHFRRQLGTLSPAKPFLTRNHHVTTNQCAFFSSGLVDDNPEPPAFTYIHLDGLTPEEEQRFKILQYEVEVLRQQGGQAPIKLRELDWRKLLTYESRGKRLNYYRFLFKTEMAELGIKRKKAEEKVLRDIKHDQLAKDLVENPDVLRYGLNFNTMFPYIRDQTILKFQNVRLAQARYLGQPLVIDVDYDSWMSDREQTNTAIQIRDAHAHNKESRDPFWLQLTNAKPKGCTMQTLEGAIPNLQTPNCLIEVSEKSYLDLFPKEKLVYLSYNAEFVLKEFSHDDIYIVGGMVDKVNPKPLSLAKAKREGLRMAKLPIDLYLRWAQGNKNLTINQVVSILCDMKLYNDWNRAFLHIPKRKLVQPEDLDPNQAPYHKTRRPMPDRLSRRDRDFRTRSVMESMLSE